MASIPPILNAQMDADPFYDRCCFTGKRPVQRHHNFIFARQAVQELWCILPLFKDIHDMEKRRDIKDRLDWIMLNRADDSTLGAFSVVDNLFGKRERLNEVFGLWTPDWYAR